MPNETIIASVNPAASYDLSGVTTADITAIQGFRYVTSAIVTASLADTAVCEDVGSSTVAITPDQDTVVA